MIIIGSGLGGLSCGLILSRNGYDVTVLEQGTQVGGCLQCFSRHGVKFETGMHFIGSADEGQVLNRLLRYLDIYDDIRLSRLDPKGYDVISLDGRQYRIANGREPFIDTLVQDFPGERDNLERYFDLVEQVASASSLHSLRKADSDASPLGTEYQLRSIDDVISGLTQNEELRHVLVGSLPLYAAELGKTPFATHAFITDFYNQSAFRVVGGSNAIATSLVRSIQRQGGRVICRQKVTRIVCDETKAVGVETADNYYPADIVICGIHPARMIELCTSALLRPAYRRRVEALPETVGGFSVYLRFKPGTMPYMNHNFYGYHQSSPWNCEQYTMADWPKGYLYMHFCNEDYQQWAEGGVILSYMHFSEVARWQGTRVGHRGADYEQMKRERAERLIDTVSREFPGLRDTIAGYETSTPLTYFDYTGTEGGSMYGIAKDINLGPASRVHHRTKIPNLLLTGQNINSHGILGVLVGTVVTCSELLTSEHIFREIVKKETETRKHCLIVGGGLGGLFTGALLTKEGYRVTVLEKNATIGGGLQTFRRGGIVFETGMHMLGGLRLGGSIHKICSYLGILDELQIRHADSDCMDSITYLSDGHTYRIPEGREAFTRYFISEFPHEEQAIRDYVEALYRLADEVDFFYLRAGSDELFSHSDQFLWPATRLIDHYIKDVRLRDVLGYMNPMYGGVADHTPAYIHALINVLYIEGQDRFAGGSLQMAQALARKIEAGGGTIVTGARVTAVHVDDDRRVTSVDTATGRTYTADLYISAIHPQQFVPMTDGLAFPKSYRKRIASIPNTYSAFTVYIKFRPGAFPYINHTCYFQDDYGRVWQHGDYDPADTEWPHGFMYMTPSETVQGEWATKMIVNCLMPFSAVDQWAETSTPGHRGADYERWKQQHVERVLWRMEQLYPGFGDTVEELWSSSPLTIRDFYNEPGGALYGVQKDCQDMMLSQIPVWTKVRNLLLTGQNINLHGICGVPLTAVNTVEAIIGQNKLVEKINNLYNHQYGKD